MLGWKLNKKRETPPAAPAAAPLAAAAKDNPQALAEWQAKLQAALGDDAALLAVAKQTPSIDIKYAAIAALSSEAALKQAERDFRSHDRRAHRAAKQRYETAVAQRLARERAGEVVASATALLAETTIPTNRLVELDRAWQAINPSLLDDAHKAQFAGLSVQLTELTRDRGERALLAQRWTSVAKLALQRWHVVAADVAAGTQDRSDLLRAAEAVQAVRQTVPDNPDVTALNDALLAALQLKAQIEDRLDLLDALPQDPPGMPTAEAPAADNAAPPPADRWQALAPIADIEIAATLNQRFEQSQTSLATAQHAAASEQQQQRKAAKQAAKRQTQQERAEAVAARLQQAEAALAAGHLAETHQHLVAIDEALSGAPAPEAQRSGLNAVHAEYARLKGWQHWGGGRARDDLVEEAQTLAVATAAALADPAQAAKLPIKQLADAIDDLRKRWKELDRLGGATNQALWHSFDAALKSSYEPVAAYLNQLKARRRENLEVRLRLLDALDAVNSGAGLSGDVQGGAQADAQSGAPADAQTAGPDVKADVKTDLKADLKEQARALDHFQIEWRKLGPLEHTVPHKARDKLIARMQASVARLEAPLSEARHAAQQVREQLVARAEALSQEAQANPHARDIIPRVRELQEQWQQHARTLPLARQVENALWAAFKAATDSVFAQRDAASSAFEAALLANLAAKETSVSRLEALNEQTPAADIKRTLAEVDTELRKIGEVPRNQIAALDTRIQAAHQRALKLLAGSAQRNWHASCDALAAKLALCDELESGIAGGAPAQAPEELAARWAAIAPLPTAWEQALALRWKSGQAVLSSAAPDQPAEGNNAALDTILLQLEAALDVASPPAFQAARRDMKLRAMKAALESRLTSSAASAKIAGVDELTAMALTHSSPNAEQRERLSLIVAALRAKGASDAGAPVAAARR